MNGYTQVDPTGSGSYTITQRYIVERSQPVLQFDNNGNVTERNLIAPNPAGVDAVMAQGAVSSLNQPDVVNWMIDDKLGSPREEVNNNSTVVNHIVYSSFGQDAYESNASVTHWAGFGGGHDDTYTGLTQDGRRWYDRIDAKWLSNDPAGFAAGDTDLSRYAVNDPTNRIDPTGLDSAPSFFQNYVYYLCNPSTQDTDIQVGQVIAAGASVAAMGMLAGIWIGAIAAGHAAGAAAAAASASASAGATGAAAPAAAAAASAAASGGITVTIPLVALEGAGSIPLVLTIPTVSLQTQMSVAASGLVAVAIYDAAMQAHEGDEDEEPIILPFPAVPHDATPGDVPQITPLGPHKWLVDGEIIDSSPPIDPGDLQIFNPEGEIVGDPFVDGPGDPGGPQGPPAQ